MSNDFDYIANSMLPNSVAIFERSVKKSKGFSGMRQRRQHEQECANFKSVSHENIGTECDSADGTTKEVMNEWTTSVPACLSNRRKRPSSEISNFCPPILNIGSDAMASILSYLEPAELLSFVIMPLSKKWRSTISQSEDLWKILCLTEPFNANYEDIAVEKHSAAFLFGNDFENDMGRYCVVYTSFVQCWKYLECVKSESRKVCKRFSIPTIPPPFGLTFQKSNSSLGSYLAQAQTVVQNASNQQNDLEIESDKTNHNPFGVADDGRVLGSPCRKKNKEDTVTLSIGKSLLSQRLLKRPSQGVGTGYVNLPWSCAIYSVVNWMISFADVIGIQIMCLKALPSLLEDDHQRTTALNAGLVDIVLTHMVHFPNSVQLHTAALHGLVLLARPVGGKEGLMLHGPIDSVENFFSITSSGKNGVDIMLESMHRFLCDEMLQAMGCWSMVNISLKQNQKTTLIQRGGINAALAAIKAHPSSSEVQFRALFALINLAISPTSLQDTENDRGKLQIKNIMDGKVDEIIDLVVKAMERFRSNASILNRSCLILYNLSLNYDYHPNILFAPGCYQLLKICVTNFKEDKVLQQGAGGTLRRLHGTLATNNCLRSRFIAMVKARQQQRFAAAPSITD